MSNGKRIRWGTDGMNDVWCGKILRVFDGLVEFEKIHYYENKCLGKVVVPIDKLRHLEYDIIEDEKSALMSRSLDEHGASNDLFG